MLKVKYICCVFIVYLDLLVLYKMEVVGNIDKEEFEDTKGLIRICKLSKDRQHNSQKKKDKRRNNDLQIKLKTE